MSRVLSVSIAKCDATYASAAAHSSTDTAMTGAGRRAQALTVRTISGEIANRLVW